MPTLTDMRNSWPAIERLPDDDQRFSASVAASVGSPISQRTRIYLRHPGDRVLHSDPRFDPLRHFDQQQIADAVAIGVIDTLKPSRSRNIRANCL